MNCKNCHKIITMCDCGPPTVWHLELLKASKDLKDYVRLDIPLSIQQEKLIENLEKIIKKVEGKL